MTSTSINNHDFDVCLDKPVQNTSTTQNCHYYGHFHELRYGEKKMHQPTTQKPAIENASIPHNKAFEAAY